MTQGLKTGQLFLAGSPTKRKYWQLLVDAKLLTAFPTGCCWTARCTRVQAQRNNCTSLMQSRELFERADTTYYWSLCYT